jgi:hypothetical protein
MNRTLPFGTHNIGYLYVIKINVKLAKKDAEELAKAFHNQLFVSSNEKGGWAKDICLHRIEGAIRYDDMATFMVKLQLAKEFCKIAQSEKVISDILESQIPMTFPEMPDREPEERFEI